MKSIKDLTCDGRHMLLIHDTYRSHISLQVLEISQRNRVIIYALPARTSGKPNPLMSSHMGCSEQVYKRF